ncbi:uncharacterized protein [Henckelia pumila]|uniref:uncharacterized protein n=1 Tax=Henckelia pumila TaxID=405737 RepID=UPI003C6E3339
MNSIWVIVDRLTKSAHFLPVRTNFPMNQYAELYIREIVRLHGVPARIVSDRDSRFTSCFWGSLHRGLGKKLAFSTVFHPQRDGQSEQVIQIFEDMLRACLIDFRGSWDEFGEKAVLGAKIVTRTVSLIAKIRDRMLTAQSRQKSYAYQRRRDLVFEYVANPSHVILHEPVEWTLDLSFEEIPIQILDSHVQRLRNKEIKMVKVLWRNHLVEIHTGNLKSRASKIHLRNTLASQGRGEEMSPHQHLLLYLGKKQIPTPPQPLHRFDRPSAPLDHGDQ